MTNFEYIMSKMTDRNFADIFCDGNFIYDEDTFGYQIWIAFENWRNSIGNPTGNSYTPSKGELQPNPFKWEKSKNNDTDEWEQTGRKDSLSFQVWLSKPYNSEEWSENNK